MTAKEHLLEIAEACNEAEAQDMLRLLDELQLAAAGRAAAERDTSAAAMNRRLGLEPVSAEVFEQHFGRLPTDDEG
jgi:AraC-like DNA-binding protein